MLPTPPDGDIPVTAIYTGASVRDSSVALLLIKETSRKVSYLYVDSLKEILE